MMYGRQKSTALPVILEKRLRTDASHDNYKYSRRRANTLKNELVGNEYMRELVVKDTFRDKILKIKKQDTKNFAGNNTIEVYIMPEASSLLNPNKILKRNSKIGIGNCFSPKRQLNESNKCIEEYYQLSIKHGNDLNWVKQLILLLKKQNTIFQRSSSIVLQSLLKLGNIRTYRSGEKIFDQYSLIKNLGLILWGEVLMKKRRTKMKFYCLAGESCCEEVLFEKMEYDYLQDRNIEKGSIFTNQYCKAYTNCGILFVGAEEYEFIFEQFARQGHKQKVIQFENILKMFYLKKKKLRKQFG